MLRLSLDHPVVVAYRGRGALLALPRFRARLPISHFLGNLGLHVGSQLRQVHRGVAAPRRCRHHVLDELELSLPQRDQDWPHPHEHA